MTEQKKGFFSKLFDKLDQKLEKKAEGKAACGCNSKDKSCCN